MFVNKYAYLRDKKGYNIQKSLDLSREYLYDKTGAMQIGYDDDRLDRKNPYEQFEILDIDKFIRAKLARS